MVRPLLAFAFLVLTCGFRTDDRGMMDDAQNSFSLTEIERDEKAHMNLQATNIDANLGVQAIFHRRNGYGLYRDTNPMEHLPPKCKTAVGYIFRGIREVDNLCNPNNQPGVTCSEGCSSAMMTINKECYEIDDKIDDRIIQGLKMVLPVPCFKEVEGSSNFFLPPECEAAVENTAMGKCDKQNQPPDQCSDRCSAAIETVNEKCDKIAEGMRGQIMQGLAEMMTEPCFNEVKGSSSFSPPM